MCAAGGGAIFDRGGAGSRDLQSIAHDGEPCLVDPDELDLDPGTAASVEQNLPDTLRRQGKARRGRASEIALLDLTAFSVLSSQPSLLPTCSILPSPSRPGSAIRNPQSLLLRCAALASLPWMPCCRTDAADAAQPPPGDDCSMEPPDDQQGIVGRVVAFCLGRSCRLGL